jgi:hypothetical protein
VEGLVESVAAVLAAMRMHERRSSGGGGGGSGGGDSGGARSSDRSKGGGRGGGVGGGGGGGGGANGGDDDKGGGDDCPLVLVGGILAEGGIVATRLASMLREHRTGYILQTSPATASDFARVRLVHPKVGPETGAAYVACRMISGDDWKPR